MQVFLKSLGFFIALLILTHSLSAQKFKPASSGNHSTQTEEDSVLFDRALSLQKNEALIRDYIENGLAMAYFKAGFSFDTLKLFDTYRFYEAPFNPQNIPDLSIVADLEKQIAENQQKKELNTDESLYPFLRLCNPDLPESYDLFLDNEFIIFSDEMLFCMRFESIRAPFSAIIQQNIPAIYTENGLIQEGLFEKIQLLQLAFSAPTDSFLNYLELPLESYTQLLAEIEINSQIKEAVPARLYSELRRCDGELPENYDAFLERDSIVVSQSAADCFLKRIRRNDRTEILGIWKKATAKERYVSGSQEESIEEESEFEEVPSQYSAPLPVSTVATTAKGIFPTTQLIDATAQFLVERTKEELILTFFDQFQQRIDSIIELRYLFTNTYSLLKNREFFHVPTLGSTWKTAFEKDLLNLPVNMERMVNESPRFLFLKKRSDYRIFLMAFHFQDWYVQSQLPSSYILDKFVDLSHLEGGTYMDSALAVIKYNLPDFRENGKSAMSWYDRQYRENLNDRGEELFVALQYHKAPAYYESFHLGKGKSSYATEMKKNPGKIYRSQQNILTDIREMDVQLRRLSVPAHPRVDSTKRAEQLVVFSEYLYQKESALKQAADGLNRIQRIAYSLKYPDDPAAVLADKDYQSTSQLIYAASQLIPAIESRDPSKIFVHSLQALQPLFHLAAKQEARNMRKWDQGLQQMRLSNTINAQRTDSLSKRISNSLKRQSQFEATGKYLAFYGGFMIDIFYARSAPEIKGLLYKYALPAGSYRIKRRSQLSIELGAYPSLYGGREFIINKPEGENAGWASGVSAPVGLTLSWPIKKSQDPFDPLTPEKSLKGSKLSGRGYSGHSFSLFFPVVDLGAPFSFRWNQGNNVSLPDQITWQQLLSPGLFAVWGMKNKPVALSFGGQYVPKLRSITLDGNEVSQFDTFRVGLNLAIDIPIFSLFRK